MTGPNDIDSWIFKEVQLPNNTTANINDAYSFLFEGIVGTSQGQLAFDDVKLYDGNCTGPVIKPDKFDCGGGELSSTLSILTIGWVVATSYCFLVLVDIIIYWNKYYFIKIYQSNVIKYSI